ncbi:hypothetical protein [Nonomuraea jabiensis]|uniref:Uncharacterized protein n=1 Tax=Nonomuraea jabiensis TaxID=882448 RepID=A0A7W9G3S0_9ACTN|nr:hypothetical protein [Nonomuraea jabiensis]MBB5776617.1 hypothetical protein [Nonomuraea jabiensis]
MRRSTSYTRAWCWYTSPTALEDADPALQPLSSPYEQGERERLANRIFPIASPACDLATAPMVSAWGRAPERTALKWARNPCRASANAN